MAKKARKKSTRKATKRNAVGPAVGAFVALGKKGKKRDHIPLNVLEKRLSRLGKLVATRRKNRSAWG